MKVICIQMDMLLGKPEENFTHAEHLIEEAAKQGADVLVLPETWNTGFFPKEGLQDLCDRDGSRTQAVIGALAAQYGVNIVAGSISNLRHGKVYNTAMVFDRAGKCAASYDKTHLFTPLGEDRYYTPGSSLCRFTLDGVNCGLITCYDIRFPEFARSLALQGLDMLFVVAQWPALRIAHLDTLTKARAIENQIFLCCCNGCGAANETVFGGHSAVIDPWGQELAKAGEGEQILVADADLSQLQNIRASIHVFRDRREELYRL